MQHIVQRDVSSPFNKNHVLCRDDLFMEYVTLFTNANFSRNFLEQDTYKQSQHFFFSFPLRFCFRFGCIQEFCSKGSKYEAIFYLLFISTCCLSCAVNYLNTFKMPNSNRWKSFHFVTNFFWLPLVYLFVAMFWKFDPVHGKL